MKTLLIDAGRCIQCCNCQNACKDEHCDNDWTPIAAKQGSSQFWIKILESQAAEGTRMRLNRTPIVCQQCENPSCIAACTHDAIYRRNDGIVIIDPSKCTGCDDCKQACAYGVIYDNNELGISQKCTMCAHLLDAGWENPRCVTACPVDALTYVDEGVLTETNLTAPLERLHPEYKTNPRVAYLNLPKPFVAGSVYSPTENRCLDKVDLILVGQATGMTYAIQSGFLGEFNFEGVTPGIYSLELKKSGYDTKLITHIDVRQANNVGDVTLMKSPA